MRHLQQVHKVKTIFMVLLSIICLFTLSLSLTSFMRSSLIEFQIPQRSQHLRNWYFQSIGEEYAQFPKKTMKSALSLFQRRFSVSQDFLHSLQPKLYHNTLNA